MTLKTSQFNARYAMTDNEQPTETTHSTLNATIEFVPERIDYLNKDRSNGNIRHLKPNYEGRTTNPRGNPEALAKYRVKNMRKLRSLYAQEGFTADQVARRMTGWLNMSYGAAKNKMNNDKTALFERLGISILVHATESGDTTRLDKLLDRIIGPVVQRTETDIRSLSVSAKADVELLARIQADMAQGKAVTLLPKDDDSPE